MHRPGGEFPKVQNAFRIRTKNGERVRRAYRDRLLLVESYLIGDDGALCIADSLDVGNFEPSVL